MKPPLHGLMVEFAAPEALLAAVHRARQQGYSRMDAYTPYPVEGLAEALRVNRRRVPPIVLLGGIVGGAAGYLMQYWVSVIAYPLNVGGRPMHSWVSFIPVTFELTILVAAFSALLGMLAMNGLPAPYHPVFNVPQFAMASQDKFFLCIESRDPKFNRDATGKFMATLGGSEVYEVAH